MSWAKKGRRKLEEIKSYKCKKRLGMTPNIEEHDLKCKSEKRP